MHGFAKSTPNVPRVLRVSSLPCGSRKKRVRIRSLKVTPDTLALRIPIAVGATGYVVHDTHSNSMCPDAIGIAGTFYVYGERVGIAGRPLRVHSVRPVVPTISATSSHVS
jgi:hypothetical protein